MKKSLKKLSGALAALFVSAAPSTGQPPAQQPAAPPLSPYRFLPDQATLEKVTADQIRIIKALPPKPLQEGGCYTVVNMRRMEVFKPGQPKILLTGVAFYEVMAAHNGEIRNEKGALLPVDSFFATPDSVERDMRVHKRFGARGRAMIGCWQDFNAAAAVRDNFNDLARRNFLEWAAAKRREADEMTARAQNNPRPVL